MGSNCLFAPNVSIGDYCLIGLGSVISERFKEENVLIAGNPAQFVKGNINWRTNRQLNFKNENHFHDPQNVLF